MFYLIGLINITYYPSSVSTSAVGALQIPMQVSQNSAYRGNTQLLIVQELDKVLNMNLYDNVNCQAVMFLWVYSLYMLVNAKTNYDFDLDHTMCNVTQMYGHIPVW